MLGTKYGCRSLGGLSLTGLRPREDVPMQQTPSPDATPSEEDLSNPSSESSTTTTSGLGGDSNANLTPVEGAAAASSSRGGGGAEGDQVRYLFNI